MNCCSVLDSIMTITGLHGIFSGTKMPSFELRASRRTQAEHTQATGFELTPPSVNRAKPSVHCPEPKVLQEMAGTNSLCSLIPVFIATSVTGLPLYPWSVWSLYQSNHIPWELIMQILRAHPRSTHPEMLRVGSSNLCVNKPSP